MDTLIKKLNLVGTIKTNDYNLGWDIYDLVAKDKCKVVSIQPSDDDYLFSELNIKDKEEWITYTDCREMTFYYINEQIAVEVKTYTHYRFGIEGRYLKWKAEFFLPIEFVTKIQRDIAIAFDKFCDRAYDNHLEFLRLQWIEKFKDELLNK
ncbi:MAG: hypothetical protein J6U90_03810 [Methanobrevibacter sp.]|nr:hypothetical protein [Methanobrevibacter sp.]